MFYVRNSICLMCICLTVLITTSSASKFEVTEREGQYQFPEAPQLNETQKKEMDESKAKIRKEMRYKLTQIPKKKIDEESRIVTRELLNHTLYKHSRAIAVYVSTPIEIQTHDIIKDILKSGKQCYIPKYTKDRKLTMIRLRSMEELENSTVYDDNREDVMVHGGLDLVIVPGVAFTLYGKRLGRGKGSYDRFLEEYRKTHPDDYCMSMALALSEQIVDNLPTTPHDRIVFQVLHPDT